MHTIPRCVMRVSGDINLHKPNNWIWREAGDWLGGFGEEVVLQA